MPGEKMDNIKEGIEKHIKAMQSTQRLRDQREVVAKGHMQPLADQDRQEAERRYQEHESRVALGGFSRWTTAHFEPVRVIGAGGFGSVHLVRRRGSDQFFALKRMRKETYQKKTSRRRLQIERDLLAEAVGRWVVELWATFQDARNVYMVMEFIPGGDLSTELERRSNRQDGRGRLSLEEVAFYTAELIEALDTVHRCGVVHRDVKPDNVMLTTTGHLKLLDFGLCSPVEGEGGPPEIVGTFPFLAPEVWRRADYSSASDVWAIGVVSFLCWYGRVPFDPGEREGQDAVRHVRAIVTNSDVCEDHLLNDFDRARAKGIPTSSEWETFLQRVLCPRNRRLGRDELRALPFFAHLDFATLHQMQAPIQPALDGPTDTRMFPAENSRHLRSVKLQLPDPRNESNIRLDPELEWSQYEFDRQLHLMQQPHAVRDLLAPAGSD